MSSAIRTGVARQGSRVASGETGTLVVEHSEDHCALERSLRGYAIE
ncbi:MAG: hypothetical protein ACKVII_28125 [Planctomycetales bacterium]|jgi:hypothetical protein